MGWGMVELEPEVRIDLLAEQGPLLSEPYTRQLDGKLRELRFRLGGQAVRVTLTGRGERSREVHR